MENGPLAEFPCFQFSQDHTETYFSLIRLSLGWNNNLIEMQFKSAYRKLLVCMPYLLARKTNCIINSVNVFTTPSSNQPEQRSPQPKFDQITEIEIDDEAFHYLLNAEIEPYEQHLRALIASNVKGNINRKILKRSKSACKDCLNVSSENQKIFDT